MDGWVDRWMDGWVGSWVNWWTDGQKEGRTGGRTVGERDTHREGGEKETGCNLVDYIRSTKAVRECVTKIRPHPTYSLDGFTPTPFVETEVGTASPHNTIR